MASQAGKMLVERIGKYRKAIKYLDSCGEVTLEKLQKAHDIAGADMSSSQLQSMWQQAQFVMPSPGQPGGKEYLRVQMKKALEEGISTFGGLARKMGVSESKLKGRGCFIATAACGTEHAPDVVCLRAFRNSVLSRSTAGRLLMRVYERVSPPLADSIRHSDFARAVTRRCIIGPAAWYARRVLWKRGADPTPLNGENLVLREASGDSQVELSGR
jgi:hypothetical protein